MKMGTLVKPPVWFRVVAVLLVLWGLAGFGGFVVDRMMTPAMVAQMSAYDQNFRANQPAWSVWAYGIATATGLLGGVALLLRRRVAVQLYGVSLVFVVLLFGYVLGCTDIIAAKGFATAAVFPIVIAMIGAFAIWLSRHASARGWIA